MALNATLSGTNSDSYITVNEAAAYHNTRLHNDEWADADLGDREKALKWATRLLDNLSWRGTRSISGQSLEHPRYSVPDTNGEHYDPTLMIPRVKEATAELAWLLIISDSTRESGTKGFNEIKVGPITLKIASDDRSSAIFDSVMEMIDPLLMKGVYLQRG